MITRSFRIFWRVVILLLGVFLAYLLTDKAVPYLDQYFPLGVVFLFVYIFAAYVGIPFLIRLWRVFIKQDHIPLYVVTSDGWPADPVNIAVITKSKKELITCMEEAGWHVAEERTMKNALKLLKSIVFDIPYKNAPFTRLFLFGREFDVGFQKPRNERGSARARHHVRFWHVNIEPEDQTSSHSEHFHFWNNLLRHMTGKKRTVWIGAAIDDTGPFGVQWRNFQITHRNDSDINRERDLIVSDLENENLVRRKTIINAGEPFTFYGQAIGNRFICDGQIRVVQLRSVAAARFEEALSVIAPKSTASRRKSKKQSKH